MVTLKCLAVSLAIAISVVPSVSTSENTLLASCISSIPVLVSVLERTVIPSTISPFASNGISIFPIKLVLAILYCSFSCNTFASAPDITVSSY